MGGCCAQDPRGLTEDNAQVLSTLAHLMEFINSFDLVRMQRDTGTLKGALPAGVFCSCISELGKQYAVYMHHSRYNGDRSGYIVEPGSHAESLALGLPAGTYDLEWLDPASGRVVGAEAIAHAGGELALSTPEHTIDIALAVRLRS